jgi:hypothetical protein
MTTFWQKFHSGQDKITICLEIQQRLLYDYCREKLLAYVADVEVRLDAAL